ncbi:hypothetical protein BKA93DRAFT_754663, partial [Sparassis latifolia]
MVRPPPEGLLATTNKHLLRAEGSRHTIDIHARDLKIETSPTGYYISKITRQQLYLAKREDKSQTSYCQWKKYIQEQRGIRVVIDNHVPHRDCFLDLPPTFSSFQPSGNVSGVSLASLTLISGNVKPECPVVFVNLPQLTRIYSQPKQVESKRGQCYLLALLATTDIRKDEADSSHASNQSDIDIISTFPVFETVINQYTAGSVAEYFWCSLEDATESLAAEDTLVIALIGCTSSGTELLMSPSGE